MNDNKQIAVYDNTVSAREYLSYIAEQAGGFACIGRDGKLYIKRIGEDVSELDIKYFQSFTWGEGFKVSGVVYEDGVQGFKFGDEMNNTIWINSDNMYIVSLKQVENVYDEYRDFECYSFEGSTIVDPAYDVGDILVIDGKRVIYQGSMDYVGKFKADISSKIQAKMKEETMVTKVSDRVKIRRVQSSIDQVKGEIETLVEEVDENSEKMTQVLQTVDDITQKVSNITDLTNTVTGVKGLRLEDAVMGAPIELHIFGNNVVFSELYFDEDWCFDGNHYFTRGNATILMNDVVYDLGVREVLRQFEGVCDEYVYEYEKGTARVIRRVGVAEDGGLYVLASEVVEDLAVPDFALKEGENVVRLLNDGANMAITYVVKNDLTNVFATRLEMNSKMEQRADEIRLEVDRSVMTAKGELEEELSKISQRADAIDLEVKKKVGENEMISKINQSAEEILIEASRVNLSGLVRVTDLSNSGSTVINGANITTGKISADRLDTTTIYSTNGMIGGFRISSNTLESDSVGISSNEYYAFWTRIAGKTTSFITWNGDISCSTLLVGGLPLVKTETSSGNEIEKVVHRTSYFEYSVKRVWSVWN